MVATLDYGGIPSCCGQRLQPIMPYTHCLDCGQRYEYIALRQLIADHRRPALNRAVPAGDPPEATDGVET